MSKMSEKIEAAKKSAEVKKKANGDNPEYTAAVKGLSRQLKMFGKTVKITELQAHFEFLKMNQKDLIDVISWAINTIKNKKEVKGQDLDKQYYRNFLKWNELREYMRGL